MAPKFLNSLPTKVHSQIFKNLLWSNGSTGFICIKYLEDRNRFGIATCIRRCEFNMCPLINLSILGTCKRINSECEELLWQRNKLRVRVLIDNLYDGIFYLQYWNLLSRDRSVFFNAQHIELGGNQLRLDAYTLRFTNFLDHSIAESKRLAGLRALAVFEVSISLSFLESR
jgi:hypothetical protein